MVRQHSIPYAMPNKIAYTVAQLLYVFILHCGIQDIINVIIVQNSIGKLCFFWLDTVLKLSMANRQNHVLNDRAGQWDYKKSV